MGNERPTREEALELALLARDTAEAMIRLEGAVRASLGKGEERALALAEFRTEMRPVVEWVRAKQAEAAKLEAEREFAEERRRLADQQQRTAFAAWLAGFVERFTLKRLAVLATILAPLCGGGGLVVGASTADRLHAALDVLLGTGDEEAPVLTPAPVVQPSHLGGSDVR